MTTYHPDTRSLLQSGAPKPSISSYDKPDVNPDGSVAVWFSPKAPKGKEKNWIKTIPGEGWSILIRLYGPLESYFDEDWSNPDLVIENPVQFTLDTHDVYPQNIEYLTSATHFSQDDYQRVSEYIGAVAPKFSDTGNTGMFGPIDREDNLTFDEKFEFRSFEEWYAHRLA